MLANIILLADFLVFGGLKQLMIQWSGVVQLMASILFWSLSVGLISFIFLMFFRNKSGITSKGQRKTSWLVAALLLSSVPKIFFLTVYGLGEAGKWVFNSTLFSDLIASRDIIISNSDNIMTELGFMVAVIPFIFISHGIIRGRYRVKIKKETVYSEKLPKAFEGLRIVHLSDFHLGSFHKKREMVKKAVAMVNGLNPDIICFTGDMVNNHASETQGWESIIGKLEAKYGKFAVLGNHDYGDYCQWPSKKAKLENRKLLEDFFQKTGFNLLLNQNAQIVSDDAKISIIGVENWGKPPFKQYGNLQKAMAGTDSTNLNILLSHDPSHWDEEVVNRNDITLTLAGHTHGAQFGMGMGNKKWSPVKMKYPRWGGLYTEEKQYLYVNRGLGFIGFPGRVGMPPEVTFIELRKKA